MKEIQLNKGKVALIDDEDVDRVSLHHWYITIERNTTYAISRIGAIKKSLHRFIINAPKGQIVDHINRNGLDCRKHNLRFVTPQQNRWNSKHEIGTSKYKGISWSKQHKGWRAQITALGKRRFLGAFKDEIEAAKVYNEAAKKYFGEFAYLNSIESTR